MGSPARETDLAAPVIALFEGWTDWHEVVALYGTADLVFTIGAPEQRPLLAVVELKRSMSFQLLEQCRGWKRAAHYVWAAVPATKRGTHSGQSVFRDYGIGLIVVGDTKRAVAEVRHQAVLNRTADTVVITERLDPEGRTHCLAGSSSGQRWSPGVRTCNRLRRHVAANEGCTLAEGLGAIEHHYQSAPSARSSMSRLLRRGIVDGLRVEQDGRALRLYQENP